MESRIYISVCHKCHNLLEVFIVLRIQIFNKTRGISLNVQFSVSLQVTTFHPVQSNNFVMYDVLKMIMAIRNTITFVFHNC